MTKCAKANGLQSGLQMAVTIKLVNHTIVSYLYCPKWHYNYLGLSAKGKGIANMNKYEISSQIIAWGRVSVQWLIDKDKIFKWSSAVLIKTSWYGKFPL